MDLGVPPNKVTVDHDGFTCRHRPPDGVTLGIGLALVAVGMAVAGGWLGVWVLVLAGLVPGLLAVPAMRRAGVQELELSGRNLVLRTRQEQRWPLDEVTGVRLARRPDDYSRPYLVLTVGDPPEQIAYGEGLPQHTLEWLVAAIEAGREHFERQQRADGREWSFLKKSPEELRALRAAERTPEGPER